MNNNRTTLEIIAPTVDEAIEKGLTELGMKREEVDIEVLDEGSRGLFGLGSRHSRIRLTVKGLEAPPQAESSQVEIVSVIQETTVPVPEESAEPR